MISFRSVGLITSMLGCLLLGSFFNAPSVRAESDVKVGVILPLSGSNSNAGQQTLHGLETALEEINALGGVLGGQKLKLVIEDTESSSKPAVDAIHKLIDVDRVPLVLGGVLSSNTIPTGKYSVRKGRVQVGLAATSQNLRKIGSGYFNMLATNEIMGREMVKFALADSGKKRVGILVMNDAYGAGLGKEMAKAAKALGAKVVSQIRYETGKTDYRTELQRLFSAKPDLILAVSFGEITRIITKQAHELRYMERVRGSWYQPYMAEPASNCYPQACEGIKGIDVGAERSLRYDNLIAKIKKKAGSDAELTWFTSVGYDSVWVAATALNLANSTNPKKLRQVMPKAFEIYRGITKADMSVDEDGIQQNQYFQRRIYTKGKLEAYAIK